MKKYELYNLTTGELLADNLTFEEVPELFEAYSDFFPDHEIIVYRRENKMVRACVKVLNHNEVARNEFMVEWLDFVDELFSIGNIH